MTLTGEQLQQIARDTPHLDVWKTREKVFLVVTDDDPNLQIITVKADPDHGDALRRDHESIAVGHDLDERNWISIGPGPGITAELIENLVHTSFELAGAHHPEPS
ncbi:MmcQ/YjbR family DNA-binding protein [Microbacterium sp. NPDC089189]|uniref:MmcQ/YjbR family DNA-binding protein n=1 Tax=Microbacterium sp. NPDC089189 TaxID=3154972 RepID=UPI0034217DA3